MSDELKRARAALAELTPGERHHLRENCLSASAIRASKIAARAEAIRSARRLYAELRDTPAAAIIATRYRRYLASPWKHQRHMAELPEDATAVMRAMHRLARATDGESVSETTIWNVIKGLSL